MNEPARTAISRRPKVASIEHADTFVDKSRAVLTASDRVTNPAFSRCHRCGLDDGQIPLAEDPQKQDDGNSRRVCVNVLVGSQGVSSRQLPVPILNFSQPDLYGAVRQFSAGVDADVWYHRGNLDGICIGNIRRNPCAND